MITSPDAILKLSGLGVWKGQEKSNGVLMIGDHVPRLESSYSRLVITPALAALGLEGVPFGNAVWYDQAKKATEPAVIYAGRPTAGTPVPVLAGVIKNEQGVMTGFPTNDSGARYGSLLLPHMKGTIIKRGYVSYKRVLAANLTTVIEYSAFGWNMCLFATNDAGLPVLAVPASYTNGVPTLTGCTYLGKVINLEKENESALV